MLRTKKLLSVQILNRRHFHWSVLIMYEIVYKAVNAQVYSPVRVKIWDIYTLGTIGYNCKET